MGWFASALADLCEILPHGSERKELGMLLTEMMEGIEAYIDEKSGMYYQVVDMGGREGNYLETSGSAMVAYTVLKACRMGILLKEKYADLGFGMVESILSHKLLKEEDGLHLTDICHQAGLGPDDRRDRDGSVKYYLSEKIVSDDSKGVGPMMMAYAQYLLLKKEMEA